MVNLDEKMRLRDVANEAIRMKESEMDYAAALTILESEGVDIDPELWAEAIETAKTGLRYLVERGE